MLVRDGQMLNLTVAPSSKRSHMWYLWVIS